MADFNDSRTTKRRTPRKVEPFVPWKPDRCEEPGCDARFPMHSRNGRAGPWRCARCDREAARRPAPPPGQLL